MTIMLALLGVGVALEIVLLCVPFAWRARRPLAIAAICLAGFAGGMVTFWMPTVFSVLLGVLCLFRAFNLMRVLENRMHERYLHRAARRTGVWLVSMQAVVAVAWVTWHSMHITAAATWMVLGLLQIAVAAVLLATTMRRVKRTAWPATRTHYSDAELPTLTVAIPARNETADLQLCLESVVGSDYPKLEIIVFDDCSQTRKTPEIIRGFAHDGVRFIRGDEPAETWLPKNQAYDRLADEANGDYVLFCGVDIRFSQTALRQIISTMLSRRKRMMAILPERAPEARTQNTLAQAMRYMWELVLPRRMFKRPPVLSSCWVIEKRALQEAGKFDAVRRSIVPEAHFARYAAAVDAYSFMRAGINPGVQSTKGAAEQRATAIRTRYPQLHRRPESVALLAMSEALFLILPFVVAVGGFWFDTGITAQILAGAAAILLTAMYWVVAYSTRLAGGVFSVIALPVVVLYDLAILHYSMWQYEFSEVSWKGRNICIPAMHVIPRLPKI